MPKELVQRVAKAARKSGDRSAMDALCLFIGIKLMYGSSAMKDVTIKKVSRTFGVGFAKAKKALAIAQSMPSWFRWDSESNTLTARRVLDRPEVIKKSNGRRSVFCIAFACEKGTPITFRSIQRQLRQGLALCPINNIQRRDKSVSERANALEETCPQRARRGRNCLSFDMLANTMCVSKSTAYREIKAMEAAGTISVTTHPVVPIVDCIDGEVLVSDPDIIAHRRGFYVGHLLCIRDCNDYSIIDIRHFRTVRNIIIGFHADPKSGPENVNRTYYCGRHIDERMDRSRRDYCFFDNPVNAAYL